MALAFQDLDLAEIDGILAELRPSLAPAKWAKLEQLRNCYARVVEILKQKRSVIRKLRKLIFGSSSEKTSQVLKETSNGESEQPDQHPDGEEGGQPADTQSGQPPSGESTTGGKEKPKKKRKGGKPKGSGRRGAGDYPGATVVDVDHTELKRGDDCPDCGDGILGTLRKRAPNLFLYAQAPIAALILMLEILRCSQCGREYRAPLTGAPATQKYDPSVAAMLAMLRYMHGLPHTRIEKIQDAFGIPMPTSTQWDILRAYQPLLCRIFEHLIKEAAQGGLVHCDDTVMRVLDLVKDARAEKADNPKARTGIFTTNIVSNLQGRQIVLFFTGRRYAGENLGDVLSKRDPSLPEILQMCDGLAQNIPADVATILCNCLTHGRRKFVDIIVDFPEEVRRVLKDIKRVYENDAVTKEQGMSPAERLAYHQEHSKPVMDALKLWFEQLQKDRLVEPNSGLGKAIAYMLKRWDKLTRFLQVPGAPLDNNLSERALKMAIVHRKNSLYYRSVIGAQLGDYFMSLGNTCLLNGVSPFDYFVALLSNIETAADEPHLWMPWNYQKRHGELENESRQTADQWVADLGQGKSDEKPDTEQSATEPSASDVDSAGDSTPVSTPEPAEHNAKRNEEHDAEKLATEPSASDVDNAGDSTPEPAEHNAIQDDSVGKHSQIHPASWRAVAQIEPIPQPTASHGNRNRAPSPQTPSFDQARQKDRVSSSTPLTGSTPECHRSVPNKALSHLPHTAEPAP